jgi:hypothetical protein
MKAQRARISPNPTDYRIDFRGEGMTFIKHHKWKEFPWKCKSRLGHVRQGPPQTSCNLSNSFADTEKPLYIIQNINTLEIYQTTTYFILNGRILEIH